VASSYSVLDALQHGERMDETLWRALVTNRNGVEILLGPEGPESGPAYADAYTRLIEFARTMYEAVVLDLPTIYAPESRAILPVCDRVYVVCNPELPSLHLTRKAIAFLEQDGFSRDQLSLVLNRLSKGGELGPQDMERVFNFPIAKVLPADDGAVHRALTAGKPIAATTGLGREITALAKSISGEKAKDGKKAAAGLSLSALLPQT
jgi:pilus assembly protein CpaE